MFRPSLHECHSLCSCSDLNLGRAWSWAFWRRPRSRSQTWCESWNSRVSFSQQLHFNPWRLCLLRWTPRKKAVNFFFIEVELQQLFLKVLEPSTNVRWNSPCWRCQDALQRPNCLLWFEHNLATAPQLIVKHMLLLAIWIAWHTDSDWVHIAPKLECGFRLNSHCTKAWTCGWPIVMNVIFCGRYQSQATIWF